MTPKQFEKKLENITHRQYQVLIKVLAGESDERIAESLKITPSTVRKHIEKLCNLFLGKPEFPGERRRESLIELFQQYKPEWVKVYNCEDEDENECGLNNAQNLTYASDLAFDLVKFEKINCDIEHRNMNFIGRKNAIAHLKTKINQGAKIILIQASAGIGKTTLATEFITTQNFEKILYLMMAKEQETISPVESIVEEWLKKDFEEEPGRDFMVSLGRLKRQLQTRKIGILIDNLEPALDEDGRFIEPHRSYVELLRVLADSMVQSVTLITSRERLCESDLNFETYRLPELNYSAWKQYFEYSKININDSILMEMHRVYGGNAKVMRILGGAVQEDFHGDIEAYWELNKADVLAKPDLKNLVNSQFKRLQYLDINTFKLLCRLGCYRYQDVPTAPYNGLLCLLWDVPQGEQRRVIESLKNRSLVEFKEGEFFLHPMIREEAIARLRKSENWETANIEAAEFWTESVKTIEIIDHAIRSLEAYYHYLEIDDLEKAAGVILTERDNKWETGEHLGRSFYRLGMLQKMMSAIERIINGISSSEILSSLYNILGDLYWLTGYMNKAIKCHDHSRDLATRLNTSSEIINEDKEIKAKLQWLNMNGLFNIGLCKLYIWELEESLKYFMQAKDIKIIFNINNKNELDKYFRYGGLTYIDSLFCIALLKSLLNFSEEAFNYAAYAYTQLTNHYEMWDSWSKGYCLLFLGMTYRNLQEVEKSFEIYNRAITYAQDSNYTQVKAKALTGLGELYRIQGEFTTALTHHQESIEILEYIGAKCDLAEAYYQLALTYQQMGDKENSQPNFDNAIKLFEEIEAPRQVERVRKSIVEET